MDLVTDLALLVALVTAPMWLMFVFGRRGRRIRSRIRERMTPAQEPERLKRPIEAIADDVRARGARYHDLPEHASYVKRAALTSAYDLVLAECCESLGQSHLLTVIPPGAELDRERRRVELVLHSFGMPVTPAA